MSISFGSASKKPYVGSKEVQEAYVGSQLVYRATPPAVYKFLGTETDYIIAGTLTGGAAVAKDQNVFRIALGTQGGVFICTTEKGMDLKFLTRNIINANNYMYIQYGRRVADGTNYDSFQWNGQNYIAQTMEYALKSLSHTILDNYDAVKFTGGGNRNGGFLDAVRFESP